MSTPAATVAQRPPWGHRSRPSDRRSVAGRTYLVGIGTIYRRPVFDDEEAARAVCRIHGARWPWRDTVVLAWVLLPEQWQALVKLGEQDSLSTLVGRFKALSSRAVEPRHRVNGWLWGRGFTDRVLAPDEEVAAAVRQLVHQPVRAGLAARPGDYAYWNAVGWPGADGGPP